jgi:hypothetical protein
MLLAARAQEISRKEAAGILQQAFNSLRNNDSASFASFWLIDDAPWPYHKRKFTYKDLQTHFEELKVFLDTAIRKHMKMESVETDTLEGKYKSISGATFKINAWFRYDKKYYRGFGMNLVYRSNRWLARFEPDYSTMRRK